MTIDCSVFTDRNGEPIREVLPRLYPNVEIFIVAGHDSSGKRYIQSAGFSRDAALWSLETAERSMREKPPMGIAALAHTYEILNGTAIKIDEGMARTPSASVRLDDALVLMVYNGLRQALSDAGPVEWAR